MLGDDCGEVACPVQQNRPICPGTCGNGVRDPGEGCDDGPDGSATCTSTCIPAGCGNGTVEGGETCDERGETATCDGDCTAVTCGDGYLNLIAGEQCDDGNTSAGDGCGSACDIEGCGNGIVEPGEDCDDAGESSTCDGDCTDVSCGDGLTNAAAGEECDTSTGTLGCEDRGFSFGTLSCDPITCALDTNGCTLLDHRCAVTVAVTSGDNLGALQYDVDYSSADGEFFRQGGNVDCISLVAGGFAAFNDRDNVRTLTGAVISLSGFVGPTDVARCRFDSDDPAIGPTSFPLAVVDASDPGLNPRSPSVSVTSVTCNQNTTTTSMPMSTTTTTLVPGARFDIEVSLNENVLLGALQYRINYAGAPGEILGAGENASCTNLTGAGISIFNNVEAERSLRHAAITLSGMQGPRPVSRCVFRTIGPPPVASDFDLVVEDASDTSILPVVVTLSISSIEKR